MKKSNCAGKIRNFTPYHVIFIFEIQYVDGSVRIKRLLQQPPGDHFPDARTVPGASARVGSRSRDRRRRGPSRRQSPMGPPGRAGQSGDEGLGLPAAKRRAAVEPTALFAAPALPGHVGLDGGLIPADFLTDSNVICTDSAGMSLCVVSRGGWT